MDLVLTVIVKSVKKTLNLLIFHKSKGKILMSRFFRLELCTIGKRHIKAQNLV